MSKTLYDVLKVSPTAGDAAIRDAHRKLSRLLESPSECGLSEEEAQERKRLIDEAHATLTDPARRARYDAMLEALSVPAPAAPAAAEEFKAKPILRQAPRILTVVNGSLKAILLLILIGILAVVLLNSSRNAALVRDAERLQAEKVKELDRKQMYPNMSEADIAVAEREAERRREQQAREQEERRQARELEESRRYADRVSEQLRRDEERIRQEKEWERKRREQEERRKQAADEAAEEARIERQRQQWREALSR